MKDLDLMRKFLGIEVAQCPQGIFLHQHTYAQEIINCHSSDSLPASQVPLAPTSKLRFDTQSAPVDVKANQGLVAQLIFLTKTRPCISYATSVLSRYMHCAQEAHWHATLQLVSYLQLFPSMGLWYPKGEENTIQGFSDSNYVGNLDDRTSTNGYLFTNGSTPISWSSKKQTSTSRSSCEYEYRALTKCTCEAIWLRRLEKELGFSTPSPMTLWCVNQSSIKISKIQCSMTRPSTLRWTGISLDRKLMMEQ